MPLLLRNPFGAPCRRLRMRGGRGNALTLAGWTTPGARRLRGGACRRARRTAYTLTEVMIVVGVISTASAAVAVTLQSLGRLNQQIREELPVIDTMSRLSLQLRDDAHPAVRAHVDHSTPDQPVLRFIQADDSEVVFELQRSGVLRQRRIGGQQVHQELYRLPGVNPMACVVVGEPPERITLRWQPAAHGGTYRIRARGVTEITTAVGIRRSAR